MLFMTKLWNNETSWYQGRFFASFFNIPHEQKVPDRLHRKNWKWRLESVKSVRNSLRSSCLTPSLNARVNLFLINKNLPVVFRSLGICSSVEEKNEIFTNLVDLLIHLHMNPENDLKLTLQRGRSFLKIFSG